jgi:hypothetical protein
MKSVREVEEYVIHPNEIKKLKLGQALLYCSKVDPHHVLMNIKGANEFNGRYERSSVYNENKLKINPSAMAPTQDKINPIDYI